MMKRVRAISFMQLKQTFDSGCVNVKMLSQVEKQVEALLRIPHLEIISQDQERG